MILSKTLYAIAYGDYWDRFGEKYTKSVDSLQTKPDNVIIISDKKLDTQFENIVYTPKCIDEKYKINFYRQYAVEICDTDWIIQSDLDDLMLPNYLDDLNEDVDIHLFHTKKTNSNEMTFQMYNHIWNEMFNPNFYSTLQSLIGCANSAYKLKKIKDVGGYKLFGWEDLILFYDLKYNGASIFFDMSYRREYIPNKNSITSKEADKHIKTKETLDYKMILIESLK